MTDDELLEILRSLPRSSDGIARPQDLVLQIRLDALVERAGGRVVVPPLHFPELGEAPGVWIPPAHYVVPTDLIGP